MDTPEVVHGRSPVFFERFERKPDLQDQTHYCPGCGHGVAHKLIAEAIENLGLQDRTVFISPVGCSVFAYYYFDTGNIQAAHGRTPAVATAAKRALPHSIVIGYQGDGDLAAIGTAEIIHAANRGEHITIFFINNAIYGMTGGQMAPTTLLGQKSTTSPRGRSATNEGFPIHMCELLATLEAPVYIERVSLNDNKNIMRARRAVRKALELQRDGAGFSFVEILSPCPTIWKLDPADAKKWIAEKMLPVFPLGVFRDRKPEAVQATAPFQPEPIEALLGLQQESPSGPAPHRGRRSVSLPVEMKFAGFGGQGMLLLGQLVAEMGLRDGLEVSWLPSYGPEMRSGSAHCHVVLAEERVASPVVTQPHVLIAMNEISLRKFGPQVREGGLILYNAAEAPAGFALPNARVLCVPAASIADGIGSSKVANVVMLGALLEALPVVTHEAALTVIEATMGAKAAKYIEANRKALEAGAEHARGYACVT